MLGKFTAILIILALSLSCFAMAESAETKEEVGTPEETLAEQAEVDAMLQAELEYGYSFEEPLLIVNPYGWVPLSAVIIFSTPEAQTVHMTVCGDTAECDLDYDFPAATDHVLPVIGLYSGRETTIRLTLENGESAEVTAETEAIAQKISKIERTTGDGSQVYNKLLMCSSLSTNTDARWGIAGYDAEGDLRYYADVNARPPHFEQLADGRWVTMCNHVKDGKNLGIMIFDLVGKIYADYHLPGGAHHDFAQLPGGNIVVATSDADGETINDIAQEVDLNTGDVVWEIDMKDIIDQTDGSGHGGNAGNWFHMNSVYYDDTTSSLIFSGRQIDGVVSVKYPEGTLNWILGDPSGWEKTDPSVFFTSTDDSLEWFYVQHCATVTRNGDILLFDNGGDRYKTNDPDATPTTGDDVYSRAVRYAIDTDNMTVSQVWTYGKERGREWYSAYISGVFEGEEDNTYWITSGGISYSPSLDQFVGMSSDADDIENQAYVDYVEGDTVVLEYFLNTNVFRASVWSPDQLVTGPMTLTGDR